MFPTICKVCNKDFIMNDANGTKIPTIEGHEECREFLLAQERAEKELRKNEERQKWIQQEVEKGFEGASINWVRRGWDTWVVNDANDVPTDFLKSWRYDWKGAVLSGSPGIGKTHMLAATALRMFQESRKTFRFVRFARFADQIRSVPFEQMQIVISEMQNTDILFIDDIGASTITDHIEDKLCQILDHRIEFKLPLFISTNILLDDAQKIFSARIMSRLLGLCDWLELSIMTEDWRQK